VKREIARIAADLRRALQAEADLPPAAHVLVPRAEPRKPPAAEGPTLDTIADEVRSCVRCALCRTRTHAVPGEGPADSELMVVGEAPGADEDRQGRPFVGKAGQLLTRMLAGIKIDRDEVFIGNVLKCRPPGNRDPLPDEVAQCRRYLMAQIAAIRPAVLLSLGRFSTQLLLGTTRGITSLRGAPRPFSFEGGTTTILPSYHPSYLLRSPAAKREAWDDLKLLHGMLRERLGDWPPPLGP